MQLMHTGAARPLIGRLEVPKVASDGFDRACAHNLPRAPHSSRRVVHLKQVLDTVR